MVSFFNVFESQLGFAAPFSPDARLLDTELKINWDIYFSKFYET